MIQPSPTAIVKHTSAEAALATETKHRVKQLRQAWRVTLDANKRAGIATIAFGLFCVETREWGRRTKQLPHGEFLDWLSKNCPDISRPTAYRWINLAEGICDALQISHGEKFDDILLHEALTLPEKKLPPAAKSLRERITALVEGKSQKQLLTNFVTSSQSKKADFPIKQSLYEKWLKKHHPDLIIGGVVTPYDKLPAKLKKEYRQYQIDHSPRASAKEQAEALMEQGREIVEDLETKISIHILTGTTWTHAETNQLKSLLSVGEEMTSTLRKALKEK
jgi:hypothetical protein